MKLVPVELTKELANHNRLRTQSVQGYGIASQNLRAGEPFIIFGPSLSNEAAVRTVKTSAITHIESIDLGSFFITTRSGSVYHLDYSTEIPTEMAQELLEKILSILADNRIPFEQ